VTAHQKHDALKALAAGTATQADLARRFIAGQIINDDFEEGEPETDCRAFLQR